MSAPLPPLLVVDDEKNMRLSLQTMLGDEGYTARAVESAEAGLSLLGQEDFFMVITDARLSGMSGYEFLAKIRSQRPNLPVLMITAYATPKLAVEVIKAGAVDYLAKPFAPEELLHAVARCAERHRLLQENAQLRARSPDVYQLEQIVGECAKMRELRQLIQTVAPTDARVLILGESGTGKELVAGALHSLSQRRNASYVRINCAAIPETLLESELFGHEKGAFTGALRQKPGRVEEADGGTLFLDEIADMSRPLQAKLLRFLEDGTFTRVGGTQELRVNVRLIAATNRDIVKAIAEDQFREDLFHRLNVVQLRLPPLRDRGEDVLLLAEYFLKVFTISMNKTTKALSPEARQKLRVHHWPGNVRELRNVIERALILETGAEVEPGSLPDFQVEARLHKTELPKTGGDAALEDLLAGFERNVINTTFRQNQFSLTKTAEQLKISRHSLRYRMQRLNIAPAAESEDDAPPARWHGDSRNMNILFSALDDDPLPWYGPISPAAKERFIVLGAMVMVALAVFIWVAFTREKVSRRSGRQLRHRRSAIKSTMGGVTEVKRLLHTRERRRRREHRPRNPTLAETGGLPPVRSNEESAGPAATKS